MDPALQPKKNYIYRINKYDHIVYVNQDWLEFAKTNQAGELTRTVLGSSLWNYLSGPEVKHVYQLLLQRLRRGEGAVNIPFRCDSPGMRRHLELVMRLLPDHEVEFVCTLLREEPRDEVKLLNPAARRDERFIIMCAWCKKVQATGWIEIEEAIERLELFGQPLLPRISHVICPSCKHAFLKEDH